MSFCKHLVCQLLRNRNTFLLFSFSVSYLFLVTHSISFIYMFNLSSSLFSMKILTLFFSLPLYLQDLTSITSQYISIKFICKWTSEWINEWMKIQQAGSQIHSNKEKAGSWRRCLFAPHLIFWGEGVEDSRKLMYLVETGRSKVQIMRRLAKWEEPVVLLSRCQTTSHFTVE